jgi:hypothetical protein
MSNVQTIRGRAAGIAAGATTANQLLGTLIQYPGSPSNISVSATCPAAGANAVFKTLTIGGRVVAPEQLVPTEAAAGRGPDANLGFLVQDVALGGDLLDRKFRNSGGAANDVSFLVVCEPITG